MTKIQQEIEALKNNNLDANNGLNDEIEHYVKACLAIHSTGEIRYIPILMQSVSDWYYSANIIDLVGDLIVGFSHIDPQATVDIFVNNIEKMYPHAKIGLQFIMAKLLALEKTKNFICPALVVISTSKKLIFKEIYSSIVSENPNRSIREIDEILVSIK